MQPKMGFAREVANCVVFMDNGRIIEVATSDEFARTPDRSGLCFPEFDTYALDLFA